MGHATADRLNRLERILVSPDRWVQALLEVRTLEGELVLRVGGCWDRHLRRYIDRPCTPHVVTLQASQVEMGRALAAYIEARLAGDDARPVILFAGGRRGGGKTWILGGLAQLAIALAVPGCWMLAVNVTAKQRREVVDAIGKIAPPKWITASVDDFRDPRTQLVTGATIQWLSAKNPAAIRQAGLNIEAVFVNEAHLLFSPRLLEAQPGFPSLIESFKRAKVRTGGKLDNRGHFQHGCDGTRYLAWKYLPRKKPPEPTTGIDRSMFEQLRRIKILTRNDMP